LERGGSSVVGRGLAGQTTTNNALKYQPEDVHSDFSANLRNPLDIMSLRDTIFNTQTKCLLSRNLPLSVNVSYRVL